MVWVTHGPISDGRGGWTLRRGRLGWFKILGGPWAGRVPAEWLYYPNLLIAGKLYVCLQLNGRQLY